MSRIMNVIFVLHWKRIEYDITQGGFSVDNTEIDSCENTSGPFY